MSEQTSAPPESSRQVDHNPEKWPNDNPFSPTQFVNDLSRAGPWGYRAPKLSREELFGDSEQDNPLLRLQAESTLACENLISLQGGWASLKHGKYGRRLPEILARVIHETTKALVIGCQDDLDKYPDELAAVILPHLTQLSGVLKDIPREQEDRAMDKHWEGLNKTALAKAAEQEDRIRELESAILFHDHLFQGCGRCDTRRRMETNSWTSRSPPTGGQSLADELGEDYDAGPYSAGTLVRSSWSHTRSNSLRSNTIERNPGSVGQINGQGDRISPFSVALGAVLWAALLVLTVQTYVAVHNEREIWLRANGVTREYMLWNVYKNRLPSPRWFPSVDYSLAWDKEHAHALFAALRQGITWIWESLWHFWVTEESVQPGQAMSVLSAVTTSTYMSDAMERLSRAISWILMLFDWYRRLGRSYRGQ